MKYTLLIVLSLFLFSCKNAENKAEKVGAEKVTEKPTPPVKETLFLSMERTPCFGTCPSYKILIFNTGNVLYEGYKYTKKIGKFKKTLTTEQLKEIQQMMDEIDITGMKDVYDSAVTDFPSTILYVVLNTQQTKKILDRVDAPNELKQFEKLIDFLVLDDKLIQLDK